MGVSCLGVLRRAFCSRKKYLLLLDYDGTLAPFRDNPDEAVPWPGVVDRLERLSALGAEMAVLTGRGAREIPALLKLSFPVEVWGSHGGEHLTPQGSIEKPELPEEQRIALELLSREGALYSPGLVESKAFSVAFHFRGVRGAERERLERFLDRRTPEARKAGLKRTVFDGGEEFRSPLTGKDYAVRCLLARASSRGESSFVACFGDDRTDEDAFRELRGRGFSFLVRSRWRSTEANWWITPPEELFLVLDRFALWIETRC